MPLNSPDVCFSGSWISLFCSTTSCKRVEVPASCALTDQRLSRRQVGVVLTHEAGGPAVPTVIPAASLGCTKRLLG